jgi:phosphatidylinositol glycan class M
MLVSDILPYTAQAISKSTSSSNKKSGDKIDALSLATLYTALYLLNPLVFTISTRGSSETVLSLFVLLTLYGMLKGRWVVAALMLGLSAHWKIYPVVYGVACLGVVGARENHNRRGFFRALVNTRTVSFAMVSAGTFMVLGAGCYLV